MIYEKYIKVLYIDLTTNKIKIEYREDLFEYLGGVGVAAKLLEETVKPDKDVFHEEQPIILAIGALTTIFPVITKTVAMFRSPLTGELGECYAGGRLAMMLFMAGYDAVVITGKAKNPTYITISKNDISFKDARAMWGLTCDETGRIVRERSSGGGKRSIIRIGPAGEKLVKFAGVNVDTYRHFGRLGLGAVFGSKNLKAISVEGDRSIPIKNFKEFFKVYQSIYKKVTSTEIMSKYHDLGTPLNIVPLNTVGGLPSKNLKQNVFEHGNAISGESFAEKNLVRKVACTSCPVGCIHIGQFRREFDKGHEYEVISVSYDYELIFALGSFLGIKSTDEILQLIEVVEDMGLDAMSTGVVLGWATEAYSKKIINAEQTIVPLEFGNTSNYIKAIKFIANKENEFYSHLAEGSAHASGIYGGSEFAMTFAKNEMPGYHTGYGAVVGAVCGARHSHLCNAGYSVDQTMLEFNKEEFVEAIFSEEKERCMLNALTICLFARKVYDRQTILEAMSSIGIEFTNDKLTELGEKILRTKFRIKDSLGFDRRNIKIPKRIFETPSAMGQLDEQTTYEMIELYNRKIDELMKE